jgi:hypothetical protein
MCSKDLRDKFNNFIVNKLIDSSSFDDDDTFYFNVVDIISETSLNEPIHHGSII